MENSCELYSSELDEYIAKTKARLNSILSVLEWNEVDTLKKSTCSGPLIAEEHKHDPNDPCLPESFESKHSIVIDKEQLKQITNSNEVEVPERFSDIQVNFTREQKLAVYDYVVLNTGKISEPELKISIPSDNQNASDMTFAEIVAKAKRKDKKLKRKYRTSKPTHIEEVRNLVHLQMQALEQYFNPKSSWNEKDSTAGCSELSRARHRSRSPRRRSKDEREWSRNRHRKYRERSKERKKSHSRKKSKKRKKSPHKSSKSKKSKHHHRRSKDKH